LRDVFLQHHAALLTAGWWRDQVAQITAGAAAAAVARHSVPSGTQNAAALG
jgi:isocitrate dehydrogenase kinase/phosphatase